MARAVILTGERGAGKTTLCLVLAALSPRFGGIASPRLYDSAGNRVGFAARCLATGDEWVLGRSDVELDGPRYGRFSFSSAGMDRAMDCLRGALTSAASRVTILDEVGPLELELGAGLAPVLPLLADAGDLLLVTRPSLVARLQDWVPRHGREVIVVDPTARDRLASVLAERFAPE